MGPLLRRHQKLDRVTGPLGQQNQIPHICLNAAAVRHGKQDRIIRYQHQTISAAGILHIVVAGIGIPVPVGTGNSIQIEICSKNFVYLLKFHNISPISLYHIN